MKQRMNVRVEPRVLENLEAYRGRLSRELGVPVSRNLALETLLNMSLETLIADGSPPGRPPGETDVEGIDEETHAPDAPTG